MTTDIFFLMDLVTPYQIALWRSFSFFTTHFTSICNTLVKIVVSRFNINNHKACRTVYILWPCKNLEAILDSATISSFEQICTQLNWAHGYIVHGMPHCRKFSTRLLCPKMGLIDLKIMPRYFLGAGRSNLLTFIPSSGSCIELHFASLPILANIVQHTAWRQN